MPTKAEWAGLKEANAALRKLPEVARIDVQFVEDVTALQVFRAAASHAPRSADGSHGHASGFLAASIRWESRPRSLSAVVGVARAAFYWKFVEYGTKKMVKKGAQPFMRPAADGMRADHHKRMIDALTRAAAKIAKLGK